jgi:hypothetical protein
MAFAVLRSAPNEPPHYKYDSMTLTEHKHVWSMVRPPVSVVVIEQFGAQTISKYGLHTVEIVGGVMALCDMLSIGVARDAPQQRRPYMDLARTLVPNGETHRMRHEVDAMSHVLFWLYHNVPGVVEL